MVFQRIIIILDRKHAWDVGTNLPDLFFSNVDDKDGGKDWIKILLTFHAPDTDSGCGKVAFSRVIWSRDGALWAEISSCCKRRIAALGLPADYNYETPSKLRVSRRRRGPVLVRLLCNREAPETAIKLRFPVVFLRPLGYSFQSGDR